MKKIVFKLILLTFCVHNIYSQVNITKESDLISPSKKQSEISDKINGKIGFFFPEQVLSKNDLIAYKNNPFVKFKKKPKKKFLNSILKTPEELNALTLQTIPIENIANREFSLIGIKTKRELNEENYNYIKNKTEYKVSDFHFSKIEKFEEDRYLELKSLDSSEIILVSLIEAIKNFIMKKDYDDLIRKFLNKEVLVFPKYAQEVRNLENYGKKIILPEKSTWIISDITYLIESMELVYILKNEMLGKVKHVIDLTELNSLFKLANQKEKHNIRYYNKVYNKFWFVLKKEYIKKQKKSQEQDSLKIVKIKQQSKENKKQLIEKYGKRFGKLISENKIDINMSKEMVKKSLGVLFKESQIKDKNGIYSIWKHHLFDFEIHFKNNKVIKIINY